MNDAELLATATRGSVVAAAGCGKTDLTARAVAKCSGRQLVLTHTNAGVETIRRRLRKMGVSSTRACVETLDGWCLKFVSSYPRLSGGVALKEDGLIDWATLRQRMLDLLGRSMIRKIVECSYDGVIVDEYQDCDVGQHEIVLKLAEIRPMRVLGDPLQAIFAWAGPLPPWADVVAAFPQVLTLTKPWRWHREGANAALGEWLIDVRGAIQAGQPIDLSDPRIAFHRIKNAGAWRDVAKSIAFELSKQGGSVVFVARWPSDCHSIAQVTGGLFQCVEPIEAKNGLAFLTTLESSAPAERLRAIVVFAQEICVHLHEPVEALRTIFRERAAPAEELRAAYERIAAVNDGDASARACAGALEALTTIKGVRVFRKELLHDVLDALRDAAASDVSWSDAFRRRRNVTSHVGRRLSRFTAGTTLLIKGMEFDHALVLHAGGPKGFTATDLYVAVTRGARSLTVLAVDERIDPGRLPVPQPAPNHA